MTGWIITFVLGVLISPSLGIAVIVLYLLSCSAAIVLRFIEKWQYEREIINNERIRIERS